MSGLSRTRTSTISKADMEASRLVFVFVRDAKPKRKVAVPVPDGYTWEDFLQQVKNKLKISGIREVFLASSGQTVSALDELQDIDELCVVEGQEPYTNGVAPIASEAALRGGMTASTSEPAVPDGEAFRQQAHTPEKHKVAIDSVGSSNAARQRDEDDSKYVKRTNPLKRLLQRVLPASFFMPGLPISNKDLTADDRTASTGGISRRRRRRSPLTLQNLLLVIVILSFIGSTLYYVFRVNVPAA